MARVHGLLTACITAALVCAGCAEDRPPSLPGTGGGTPGGGGGGGGGADAAPAAADAAPEGTVVVSGVACAIDDLRAPTTCTGQSVDGLTVSEPGTANQVTTDQDGGFVIAIDAAAAAPAIVVEGTGFRTSVIAIDVASPVADVLAPVMSETAYTSLVTSLGVTGLAGTATIAAYFVSGDAPAAGIRTIGPAGVQSYYDITSAPGFNALGPTAAAGASLMLGVPAASSTTSFTAADAGNSLSYTIGPVPIAADAISYLWADVTP